MTCFGPQTFLLDRMRAVVSHTARLATEFTTLPHPTALDPAIEALA